MSVSFLLNKLQKAPAGFGFCDVGEWLQDVPHFASLVEIEPIFFENLSTKELLALITLLKHRYLKEGPAYNLFDDCFQTYLENNEVDDFYNDLALYHDTSKVLDFSMLQQVLTKLIISHSSSIEQVILPVNDHLEVLELSYLPNLTKVDKLTQVVNLKYLSINQCPLLSDFDFIGLLDQLLWLDLSKNAQLVSLDFLSDKSKVVMLQLLETNLLDNELVWQQLAQLPYLKYLTITGTQSQLQRLRQHLPLCVVNGMTAYSKANMSLL